MCALLPVFPGVPWVDALQLQMWVGTDRSSQLLQALQLQTRVGTDRSSQLLRMLLGASIRGRESRVPWSSSGRTWLHAVVCVPGSGGGAGASPGALTPPAQKLSKRALGERLRALWEVGCVTEGPPADWGGGGRGRRGGLTPRNRGGAGPGG